MHVQHIIQHPMKGYTRDELTRTYDAWRMNLLGLQKNGGLDIDLFLTATAELLMDEETFREWSIYTAKEETVPSHKVFLQFLKE